MSIPIKKIDDSKLDKTYPLISEGSEGKVYLLDDENVIKLFNFEKLNIDFDKKTQKIKELANLTDNFFAFPKGLITFDDNFVAGYYMHRIKAIASFASLKCIKDINVLFDIFIKGSDALEWAHDKGIIVGDIKWNNLLLDENFNPIFIDTDNYSYHNFGFDLIPAVIWRLKEIYNEDFSLLDIDRYLYAYLVVRELFSFYGITLYENDKSFQRGIAYLEDDEIKDDLRLILSNHHDKPPVGPILKRVKNRQNFLNVPPKSNWNILSN